MRASRLSRTSARARLPSSPPPSATTPARNGALDRGRRPAAAARRDEQLSLAAADHQAARPPRRTASRASTVRRALGHVALEALGRAERHRGRDVEHDPRGHQPLGHVQPHVRHARPRAGRGVELADVVARLVRAQLRELGARARRPAPCARPAARPRCAGRAPGRAPPGSGPASARGPGCPARDSGRAWSRREARLDRAGRPPRPARRPRAPGRGDRRGSRRRSAPRSSARAGGAGRRAPGRARRSPRAWPRPRSSASARAAWTRPIGPRGLAPYST